MTEFRLQFDVAELPSLAAKYVYEDDSRVLELGSIARERGWYARDEFVEISEWKSPRIRSRVARNTAEEIELVTRSALSARDPVAAIATMRMLHGVDWAVGSVFLHLAHRDLYPILDFRALEAFGVGRETPINLNLWLGYVAETRSLATRSGLTMRTVDRALWQWSKEQATATIRRKQRRRQDAPRRASRPPTPKLIDTPADVIILGCVSSKRHGTARAKDLYISPLWKKRRAYAERSGLPWVIFSAEHGILDPEESIHWYNVALAHLPPSDRKRKGEQAAQQLAARFGDLHGKVFEIHAGSAYASALDPPLRALGGDLINRLEGLSIGYQLQWYGQNHGNG